VEYMKASQDPVISDSAQLFQFAQRYTAAWCSQVPARVADCYSMEGSLCINGGVPAVGRAAIAGTAKSFMDAFPDMRVVMDGASYEAGHPVYRWTLIGTNSGPGGTGRQVEISGFEQWRFGADGLIAISVGSFDAEEYSRQLNG
jgi:SnoaL-like domain